MMQPSPRRLRIQILFVVSFSVGCSGQGDAPSNILPTGAHARLELEAAYPEPFSFLGSVRELSDGRILAADPLSQVLLTVNLSTGTADTLGGVGGGPQEYEQPDQVFPLPGDSTLLMDLGKVQLTVVDPEGVFHTGMKMATVTESGPPAIIIPETVDGEGRLYYTGAGGMGQGPPDSTMVLRYDRTTQKVDTVGWAWRPEPIVTRSGDNVRMTSRQMAGRDDWAVGFDGRLAIIRAEDYSVEWYYPDGRMVKGPANTVETPRITDEDKLTYLEERSGAGLMVSIASSGSGAMEMSMSRGGMGMMGDEPNLLDYEWAQRFPPFRPDRSMTSPQGELWVERWLTRDQDPQMDVFDGEGTKLGTVNLPEGRELIGFGSTAQGDPAVYLVRTDELDLKWLERYRILR